MSESTTARSVRHRPSDLFIFSFLMMSEANYEEDNFSRGGYEKKYGDESKADNQGTNLFVTGLAPKAREDDLSELFSAYGVVDKVQIMRDPHTADSRGFGFVNFQTKEQAERALALDGTVFMDRTLVIQKVYILIGKAWTCKNSNSRILSWPNQGSSSS